VDVDWSEVELSPPVSPAQVAVGASGRCRPFVSKAGAPGRARHPALLGGGGQSEVRPRPLPSGHHASEESRDSPRRSDPSNRPSGRYSSFHCPSSNTSRRRSLLPRGRSPWKAGSTPRASPPCVPQGGKQSTPPRCLQSPVIRGGGAPVI
jgi:hypothetical protein